MVRRGGVEGTKVEEEELGVPRLEGAEEGAVKDVEEGAEEGETTCDDSGRDWHLGGRRRLCRLGRGSLG